MENIKSIVNAPGYDFLRTNRHLGNNLLFVCFGGSHAYGTNNAYSDVDIRGCAVNHMEQVIFMVIRG